MGIMEADAGNGFSEKYGCCSAFFAVNRFEGSYVNSEFNRSMPSSDKSGNSVVKLLYLVVKISIWNGDGDGDGDGDATNVYCSNLTDAA